MDVSIHPVSLEADSLEVMGEVYSLQLKKRGAASQQEATAALILSTAHKHCLQSVNPRYTDATLYPGLSVCLLSLSHLSGAACAEVRTFILSRFKRSRWLLYSPGFRFSFFLDFLQTEYLSPKLSSLHICSSQSKTNIKYKKFKLKSSVDKMETVQH